MVDGRQTMIVRFMFNVDGSQTMIVKFMFNGRWTTDNDCKVYV